MAINSAQGGSTWRFGKVSIITDPTDTVAAAGPARWAAGQMRNALDKRGVPCDEHARLADAGDDALAIVVAGSGASAHAPSAAESFTFTTSTASQRPALTVAGPDSRGLVYGLLELADRISFATDPMAELLAVEPAAHQPANRIRSIARLFTSDVEDKAWFHDESFWESYLSMLVAQRFNRFSLTLGLGYNSPRHVRDSYFYFAYPFLVSPEGWDVRAVGLDDAERDANLAMLRHISELATDRGLHFQLGLWTHAYEFIDSPDVNYRVTGLSPETHAPYCAAALEALLTVCPAIGGVTFRSHSESGIPEGSAAFWQAVFEGIVRTGRQIEIDIHSKGIDHDLLDMAVATGMPVNVSPKYWAEHMGLPYHQAAIRELERRPPEPGAEVSLERKRRFTRYGYADYLREDRRYGVLHRIWPGTQRLLLWGDPAIAAGYGRFAHFCDSAGVELCEPGSFKGRMGSGLVGDRGAYADESLCPTGGDWEKHLYTYRLWGRLLYDPDAPAESWRRYLRSEFGDGSEACESALAHAGRILPLVTVAHHPSASNNSYWPEIYTNMPISDAELGRPYHDTPEPRVFGAVSPLDPVMFVGIDEFADEVLSGSRSGRCSPLEVARRLDAMATKAEADLARATETVADARAPAFRRLALDVVIQAKLGRFFACKLRAGLAWTVGTRSSSAAFLREAIRQYRAAREAWSNLADKARGVYVEDVTFGFGKHLRGHWADRLGDIDADITAMEGQLAADPAGEEAGPATDLLAEITAPPDGAGLKPRRPACLHLPPDEFERDQALRIELAPEPGRRLAGARLHYRHANQAEQYRVEDMTPHGRRYEATVPAAYSDSPYALVYYFELHGLDGDAWLWPGLADDLSNQPYFVVRAKRSAD